MNCPHGKWFADTCEVCQKEDELSAAQAMIKELECRLEVLEREHAEFFERWHGERRKRERLTEIIERCSRMLLAEPDTKSALFSAENILREAREQDLESTQCTWTSDNEGSYYTACGQYFSINEGTPEENGMRFCHYCGAGINVVGCAEWPHTPGQSQPCQFIQRGRVRYSANALLR